MAQFNFQIERNELESFKHAVGERNIGPTLRNFIKSYTQNEEIDEKLLRKKFEMIDSEYMKLKAKWVKMKNKIEEIDMKRKEDELKNIKKEEKIKKQIEDIEYDTAKANLWRMTQ